MVVANVTGWVDKPAVCHIGGGGMVLPVFGDSEQQWPTVARAFIYGIGMIYLFLGVAIIADAFVAAIETVTARKRQYTTKSGKTVTEKVWNDTVATLSLMALGSSAPEIALSVVDLFKKEFHFTPLGAQTIAGSAAFNLLVIVAVCIVVIPSTETRKVEELPAFYVTAVVSVFAYLWLALILIVLSPDVVEIWEAVATFLFLPMLIWVSYKVDVGDAQRLLARLTVGGAESQAQEEQASSRPIMGFAADSQTVEAAPLVSKTVDIAVKRPENATGVVTVNFRTEHLGAVPDYDYVDVQGRLEFAAETPELTVQVEVLPKTFNRCDRKFLLILEDISGDAEFDCDADGGEDAAVLTVTITTGKSSTNDDSKLARFLESIININSLRKGSADWKEQVLCSVYCNGSYEDQLEASKLDWMMHIITLPWKLLFSTVPPTSYFGGWACFYVSLAWIGILTIFISDLAELFGCVLEVRDDVTALVFVALGTSMPDLFASLSAAKEEPTADASIVNVTGSNSVNVFLGLGLPWTVGAIYWSLSGKTDEWVQRYTGIVDTSGSAAFVVEAKNLGFCVMIFGAACIVALLILHFRRKWLGAELGGPFIPKVVSFSSFIIFWLGFIGVACWRVTRWSEASSLEQMMVIGATAFMEAVVTIFTIVILYAYKLPKACNETTESPQEEGRFMRRSQSGLSVDSNFSRSSKNSKGSRGMNEGMMGCTVTQGIMLPHGVTGTPETSGVGLRVTKPRYGSFRKG